MPSLHTAPASWVARALSFGFATVLLLAAAQARAQSDYPDEAKENEECAKLEKISLPVADRPTKAEAAQLKGCDAEALYYGIGMPADPVAARKCAWIGRDRERSKQDDDQDAWSGSAILMTVYANGKGAARNLDAARRLACEVGGSVAELEGRLDDLRKRKEDPKAAAKEFSLCDDITSGFMMGNCAAHDERIAAAKRKARLDRVVATWTPARCAAFAKLQAARSAFVDAHVSGELDLSGTARGMFEVQEEARMDDEFVATLEKLDRKDFPGAATAADYKAADAALNLAYKSSLPTEKPEMNGEVTRAGIRNAERAWIVYRDAWVEFGAVARPDVSADAWRTWLTRDRTAQLSMPAGDSEEDH